MKSPVHCLLIPLLVTALGCGAPDGRRSEPEEAPQPNVVVIVVDTLRADRLSFYGSPVETAPFLSELAKEGLVFENAWSPSSWTLPATVSVMTSTHPFQHGVTSLEGLELGPDEEPIPVNYIPDDLETLAEVSRAEGYRTFGIVSNILVGEEVGFERGFDRFIRLEDEDAEAVNGWVEVWEKEILEGQPFLLYLHYFDPHDPFHVREPWFRAPGPGTRSGSDVGSGWPDDLRLDGERVAADLDWIMTRVKPLPSEFAGRKAADLTREETLRLLDWLRAAYDSEIGFVDSRIRAVYQKLGLDDAVVVFLADHGEEFYEHGNLTHGLNLYRETVRVPLFLRRPGGAGAGRVARDVSTLDVLPTLRRLLGLPASRQDLGSDLLAPEGQSQVLSYLDSKAEQRLKVNQRSIVSQGHRLVAWDDGRVELYDLAADPSERFDLAKQNPEWVADLVRLLGEMESAAPVSEPAFRMPPPSSEAMIEHLKGLGYVE